MYTNPYLAPPVPTYAKGGSVASRQKHGLEAAAEQLRQRGRNGDTILAHINPQEARMLKAMGGNGTINPATGLPEFWKNPLKKIVPKEIYNPISSIGKGIERGVESVAKALGPAGQIAAAYFGGPIGAAIYAGLAPPGSSFDVKRAATAAALTYGTQQLMNAGAPTGGEGAVGGGGFDGGGFDMGGMGDAAINFGGGADAVAIPLPSEGIPTTLNPPPTVPPSGGISTLPSAPTPAPDAGAFDMGGIDGAYNAQTAGAPVFDSSVSSASVGSGVAPSAAESAVNLLGAVGDTALTQAIQNPKGTLTAAYLGYTAVQTKEELERQREEAERILRDQENQTRERIEFAQSVLRDYPLNYQRLSAQDVQKYGMAAGGLAGLTAMAKGGTPPRYVKGGGDGMSDSIPARIGGVQEARLADSEFVIPADVVSHLGNGSSDAGAKKLYAMMDRVRQARTGKKRQAPAIKAERVMPA